MANYVKLSELEEGTICNVEFADGSLEEYVLAKHNYESELNGAGRVLFVSKTSSQFAASGTQEVYEHTYTNGDGEEVTSKSCPFRSGVYFNSSGVVAEALVSKKFNYNLCFTLKEEVLVDVEDNNKLVFYASTLSSPLYSYIGVNNVPRIIGNFFVGVENASRRVKSAYIGVNNLARQWYRIVLNGIKTDLIDNPAQTRRSLVGGARIGDNAVFVGGYTVDSNGNFDSRTNLVEVFNKNGTTSTASSLPTSPSYVAGASIGTSAIFGGGETGNYKYSTDVYMYDENLSQTTLTNFPDKKSELFGASTKDYALFGGGIYKKTQIILSVTEWMSKYIYPYSASGTLQSTINLSSERGECGVASINDGVIAAGGFDDYVNNERTGLSAVNFISNDLTVTSLTGLKQARGYPAGASNGKDLVCFLGGAAELNLGTAYSTIDMYDNNLTRTSVQELGSFYRQIYAGGYIPTETKKTPNGCFVFVSLYAAVYIDAKTGTILTDLTSNTGQEHTYKQTNLCRSQTAVSFDDSVLFYISSSASLYCHVGD